MRPDKFGNDCEGVDQIAAEYTAHFCAYVKQFSVADVEELRDAQAHPKKHRDSVMRVWGYNAYFIDLDDGLQRHIIERTL